MDEIVTKTIDHKQSVMKMLPPVVSTAIFNIPEDYISLDCNELAALTPRQKFTMTDNKLRIAFWREHSRAIANMCHMNVSNIVRGVCSRNYFTKLLSDKPRLAYLILPPDDYEVAMEEFTGYGIDKLRESFDDAVTSFKETKDPKMYESIRKTVEMLIVHTKGEPVRRVENTNKNLNLNASVDGAKAIGVAPASMDELDRKLKELEAEERLIGERPMLAGPAEQA